MTLETPHANRREILLALEEFRDRALAEPGCIGCEVFEDISRSNRFIWMEWWLDRARADRAVNEPRYKALIGAVRLLGAVESLEWLARSEGPAVCEEVAAAARQRPKGTVP